MTTTAKTTMTTTTITAKTTRTRTTTTTKTLRSKREGETSGAIIVRGYI